MIARQLLRTSTTVSLARQLASTSVKLSTNNTTSIYTPQYNTIQQRYASSIPSFNVHNAVNADTAKNLIDTVFNASEAQAYHASSVALAVLFPAGLILSPSFLVIPVDLALGIALPLHSHIGLVQIIEDYVPRQYQNVSKLVLTLVSTVAFVGLFKINLCGSGISESFKSLWRNGAKQHEQKLKQIKQ